VGPYKHADSNDKCFRYHETGYQENKLDNARPIEVYTTAMLW